ncbi:MAG: tRNA (guanosine(37)-N1)-methyltransferase TrmD [Clostridia bacterium]|nr:tRNA (guanosine(37)-N1)-methyltransferase TrmD [Clostridia bacterium]
MKIKILTLFPEMLSPMLSGSILGRAIQAGHLEVELINIRDYAANKHKNTDDYPFGGGAGMVMMPQPVVDAIEANAEEGMRRIYMSPRGRTLNQKIVEEYAKCDSLLFLCGHYEGVDQRALDLCIDEELSIGEYVLTGGELGALVTVDAVARLIPGVLGCDESSEDESFSMGLLEYPQYTRPADFRGMKVPEVLLGGVHADIEAWRRSEALKITRQRRPDMLDTAPLTSEDHEALNKMARAEEIIAWLAGMGMRAERADIFEEAQFSKTWISHFIPEEKRKSARKACITTKKHVGYLYQAFERGYISPSEEMPEYSGKALLYYDGEELLFRLDRCENIGNLPKRCVLSSPDWSWTVIEVKGRKLYFFKAE